MSEAATENVSFSGMCSNTECETILVVDGDGKDLGDPQTWHDEYLTCPVCGTGSISLDEQVETLWQRENRLIKAYLKLEREQWAKWATEQDEPASATLAKMVELMQAGKTPYSKEGS